MLQSDTGSRRSGEHPGRAAPRIEIAVLVPVQHDTGLQFADQRLQRANVGQGFAPVRQARQWWMVDQHATEQTAPMHIGQQRCQALALRAAQRTTGKKRRRRHGGVQSDQCHTPAFTQQRIGRSRICRIAAGVDRQVVGPLRANRRPRIGGVNIVVAGNQEKLIGRCHCPQPITRRRNLGG